MELKRYALTKRNEIIDLNEHKGFIELLDAVKTFYRDVLGIDDNASNDVVKTSDNILDLVEVGDLVEIPQTIIRVDKVFNNGAFETLVSREYSKVIAIYKRQPSGDYKRYEVK